MRQSLLIILTLLSLGCNRDVATSVQPSAEKNSRSENQEAPPAKPSWPFNDEENTAVITLQRIVDKNAPILYVSHDSDDGGWQFLDGGELTEEDASVVSLRSIWELDPTIGKVADLPLGWTAEREAVGKPWRRKMSD